MRAAWLALTLAVAAPARADEGEGPDEPAETAPAPAAPAPAPAPAVPPSTPAARVVGAAGSVDAPRVILADGRVLELGAAGWTRVDRGGVAVPLAAAALAGTEVVAIGAEPPAFHFVGDTWRAAPVRRSGAGHIDACGGSGLSAGRRIFVRTGRIWKELGMVPKGTRVAAVCASGGVPVVLTDTGELLARRGAWKPAATGVTWLGGGLGAPLWTDARGGTWELAGDQPRRVALPAGIKALVPRAAGGSGATEVVLAELDDGSGARRTALVTRQKGRWKLAGDAPALPAPPAAILVGAAGRVAIVAADGAVWQKDAGGAWGATALVIASSVANPARASGGAAGPARVGPSL